MHRSRGRQQQHKTAPRIHDAGHGQQAQSLKQVRHHRTGQGLQKKGARPQDLGHPAAVGLVQFENIGLNPGKITSQKDEFGHSPVSLQRQTALFGMKKSQCLGDGSRCNGMVKKGDIS